MPQALQVVMRQVLKRARGKGQRGVCSRTNCGGRALLRRVEEGGRACGTIVSDH